MSKLHGMAKRDARSTAIAATVFLFPAVALLLIYMVYPIIDTFLISRLKWNGFLSSLWALGEPREKTGGPFRVHSNVGGKGTSRVPWSSRLFGTRAGTLAPCS